MKVRKMPIKRKFVERRRNKREKHLSLLREKSFSKH